MVDLTLATTKLDTEQANYLATVLHASESLLLLINGILDISKIEAGKMILVPEVFCLSELLLQAANTYRYAMDFVNARLIYPTECHSMSEM